MVQVSRSALILTAVLTFAGIALGAAQHSRPTTTPQPKNASGCTRRENAEASPWGCTWGPDACYDCEYTDRYGTYQCYEAPDPADGTYCKPIFDQQN
jgi:hypothetical protein